jgi:DNA-binding Xre family transcriptional regulator
MISYKPLFDTMKKRGISSYRLEKMGFSRTNYYSIKKGNAINTTTIDTLCKLLNCSVMDIMEYIPDSDNTDTPNDTDIKNATDMTDDTDRHYD